MRLSHMAGAVVVALVLGAAAWNASGNFPASVALASEAKTSPHIKVMIGEANSGSGVHIGDGLVLTVAHVVNSLKPDPIMVRGQDGKKREAEVLWQNTTYDLALVRIPDDGWLDAVPMSCVEPSEGADIAGYGNPDELEAIRVWGRVAGHSREFAGMWKVAFLMDMTILPGMSGGAVMDEAGNLVGLISGMKTFGMMQGATGFSVAVPTSVACSLLGRS